MRPSDRAREPARPDRVQILVATRDEALSRRTRAALGDDFDVVLATDDAGIHRAVFEEGRPALALVDVAGTDAWGLSACATLAALPRGGQIPALALSSPDDLGAIRAAYAQGALDFVPAASEGPVLCERVRFALRSGRAIADARQGRMRLTRVQRIAHLGSWVRDLATGRFTADAELLRIFQLDESIALDAPRVLSQLLERVHEGDRGRVAKAIASSRPHRMDYRVVVERSGPPELVRVVQQEAWLTQDEANGDVQLIGAVLDVSELKETQARVARMAYVDALTGLPNRAFLRVHLEQVLARARRYDRKFALMMLDLDMFKRVNDTLGHAVGDLLLETVARRVAGAVRASDVVIRPAARDVCATMPPDENTVARLGGDEFIVLLNELGHPADAAIVARRILDSVGEPFDAGGTRIFPACSIGIAVFPDNGGTSELLLKHADTALYHVKEQGRRSFHFFSDALTERADERMRIEVGLRAAMAEQRLELHYQPKVELATGRVTGVEALARWPKGDGTFVAPDKFIPVAEDIGLIEDLGRWVLHTACAQAAEWCRTLPAPLPVAVNVSGRQLGDPRFEAIVAEILAETQLPPHLLELEVTEGSMMKDIQASAALLGKIKGCGVRVSIDDFGTGYSSLSCLTRLPIDTLKIDRAFIGELGKADVSESIVVAILAMCRALSLRVVAEGVETAEHAATLTRYGCAEAQGYLFARPMPAAACAKWIVEAASRTVAAPSEHAPRLRLVGR